MDQDKTAIAHGGNDPLVEGSKKEKGFEEDHKEEENKKEAFVEEFEERLKTSKTHRITAESGVEPKIINIKVKASLSDTTGKIVSLEDEGIGFYGDGEKAPSYIEAEEKPDEIPTPEIKEKDKGGSGALNKRENPKRKRSKLLKKPVIRINPFFVKKLIVFFAVVFVLIYIAGFLFFSWFFFPGTVINGVGCGLKDAKGAEELIREAISGYQLEVNGRNSISCSLLGTDIGLKPVFNGEVKQALRDQKRYKWFLIFRKRQDITIEEVTFFSKESLREKVKEMAFFEAENIKKPRNAYLSEATHDGYKIIKEDNGAIPVEGTIIDTVADAVRILSRTVDIDNNECYRTADITSEDKDLNTLMNNLNKYCAAQIIYKFGEKEEVLDGTTLSEWVTVDGLKVEFDDSKVSEYVKSLARRYDTFGQPHDFLTHSGEEIKVIKGAYGWWIDRNTETNELLKAIKSGYRGERTPVFKEKGAVYGENDYGSDYVEVDLTSQHLWVYKDNKVVEESDFVSGNVSKNLGTHVGIYGITYKERDATLSGSNYASHVDYWMPFNGNEGMHDASWRSSFGGEIYLTNGSHGCINLPVDKAAKIFDLVEEGEAVIIYGGKEYKAPKATPEDSPAALTPEQQLQLLINAGFLNPDGSLPDTTTIQE